MIGRFIFAAMYLATASTVLAQNVRPAPPETHEPRPIAGAEGRKIMRAIPTVDVESESETDCSHFVHDIYEQAGFPYEYVSSRELYIGSTNFTRVRVPQAGDLVVWRGHVGIVFDPQQHSFFSFVSSGRDTQFYDSPYWRSRGIARFFRYVPDKALHAVRASRLRITRIANLFRFRATTAVRPFIHLLNCPSRYLARIAPVPCGRHLRFGCRRDFSRNRSSCGRENPSPEEVVASFDEMNHDSGETLRTGNLNGPGKSIVVYRDLRVLAMQIKGKRGTRSFVIESLAAPGDAQGGSQLGWKEKYLELKKTKKGWVMSPLKDAAYVNREVALRVLSVRLTNLSKNTDPHLNQNASRHKSFAS